METKELMLSLKAIQEDCQITIENFVRDLQTTLTYIIEHIGELSREDVTDQLQDIICALEEGIEF